MSLIVFLEKLMKLDVSAFQTSDAAALLGVNRDYASQLLGRLTKTNHLIRLKRGLWAFPNKIKTLELPQLLMSPFPCYLSLQTALHLHGMIDQVPEVIYAVSLARTQKIQTALGTVSIHHIKPDFFFGFNRDKIGGINIAKPEKALVDILYLTPARSGLFKALPEVELPPEFSQETVDEIVNKISSAKRRQLVKNRIESSFLAQLLGNY